MRAVVNPGELSDAEIRRRLRLASDDDVLEVWMSLDRRDASASAAVAEEVAARLHGPAGQAMTAVLKEFATGRDAASASARRALSKTGSPASR